MDTIGWRWTFWLGVPLAVLAMLVIAKTLKLVHVSRPVHIDWWGATVLALATCLLLIWVSFAGNPVYFAWVSWQSAAFVTSVLGLVVLFLWLESRSVEPVMNLRIFRNRTTVLAIVASVCSAVLMFSIPAYLGLYFQNGRGLGPTESGLLLGATTAAQTAETYANGSGALFLVAALIALPTVLAVCLIREVPLRRTV